MTTQLRKRIEEFEQRPGAITKAYPVSTEWLVKDLIAALKKADAEAEAVEWCAEHLADVGFHCYSGEPPQVFVAFPVDINADLWRDATAPTLVEAVALARAACKEVERA